MFAAPSVLPAIALAGASTVGRKSSCVGPNKTSLSHLMSGSSTDCVSFWSKSPATLCAGCKPV